MSFSNFVAVSLLCLNHSCAPPIPYTLWVLDSNIECERVLLCRHAGELKRKLAEEGSLDFVERRTAPLQSCYAPALFARLRQAGEWVSFFRSSALLHAISSML